MKRNLLFFCLSMITLEAFAQTTFYGTGAGTLGTNNSFFGYNSGRSVTSDAVSNSFFGEHSGQATTNGQYNTATGSKALYTNTGGDDNTAVGFQSLYSNNGGGSNTAVGSGALRNSTTGSLNTGIGFSALAFNLTGRANVSVGDWALGIGTEGNENTAVGNFALWKTSGSFNTALGSEAGSDNTSGSYNTSIGAYSFRGNATGTNNTSAGYQSMKSNKSGHFNAAFGMQALIDNETGSLNSAFGAYAGPNTDNLTNTTALGYNATPTASNQVRIGNTSVTSIGGKVSWSTFSDGRFKKEVKEDVSGLEFINQLRPVSYTLDENAIDKFLRVPDSLQSYNTSSRKPAIRQTGFIAQEVEAVIKKTGYVFHGVEAPQNEGDHYAIRYAEFVVPLVKAVQELTAIGEAQQKEIEELKQQLIRFGEGSLNEHSRGAVLFQNNPNPFSGNTEIRMSLPESAGQANIIVYNLEGKQLKVIPIRTRGNASVTLQGNDLSAGMYIYTLIVDNKVVDSKRMILTGY